MVAIPSIPSLRKIGWKNEQTERPQNLRNQSKEREYRDQNRKLIVKCYHQILCGRSMNPRTSQNQRKIRVPKNSKKRLKKEKVPKVITEVKQEESCQIRGCGCGN